MFPSKKNKEAGNPDAPIGEVILRFLEGENEGVELRVNPPRELTMGRSEECDIFLAEKKISRKHCKLVVEKDDVKLQDLSSTNGTFVNARKVSERKIENGDKIKVGSSVIEVVMNPEAEILLDESAPRPAAKVEKGEDFGDPGEFIGSDDEPSGVVDRLELEPIAIDPADIHPYPEPAKTIPAAEKKPKPLTGNLSAMGLADLLQNLSQNRKSGVLRLQSKATEGSIVIVEGKVTSATIGAIAGAKALYRMLGWSEGEFELLSLPADSNLKEIPAPINETLESLLMEGFRQFDELQKIRKALPASEAVVKLKPQFTAPLSKLHPRVLDILQLVINEREYSKVMDRSPLSDLETAKIVFYLLKKGYVVAE